MEKDIKIIFLMFSTTLYIAGIFFISGVIIPTLVSSLLPLWLIILCISVICFVFISSPYFVIEFLNKKEK